MTTDSTDAVEALRARVHRRACACCGQATGTAPDAAGWSTCRTCAPLVDDLGVDLASVVLVLGLGPGDLPPLAAGRLDGRPYALETGARADRPLAAPWDHVGVLTHHDLLVEVQALVALAESTAGGPCWRCGSAWSYSWHDGPEEHPICAACATDDPNGLPRPVDAVASRLVGLHGWLPGLADAIGFRWAGEVDDTSDGRPWGHLDREELRRRAAAHHPHPEAWRDPVPEFPAAPSVPPAEPALVDHAPCGVCGVSRSLWAIETPRESGLGRVVICAACDRLVTRTDGHLRQPGQIADAAATALAGRRGVIPGAAAEVGFVLHATAGGPGDRDRRFAYLDGIAGVWDRLAELGARHENR